jgi:nucleoporin NUP2
LKPGSSSGFGVGGFGFGAAPKKDGKEDKEGSADASGAESAGAGAEDEPGKLIGSNVHEAEGEGEENEDTTHAIKSKVYKFVKEGAGAKWADMGVGILRLKKHKETGARRVLLRNSSTGKILIVRAQSFHVFYYATPADCYYADDRILRCIQD